MSETTSCRRSAIVNIIAAITMVICLLAFFGGIGMRRAYADDTENIAFSVPAKVPFAVKADGTVIGPSASAWRIENEGTRPLRMKDVAASGFDDGSAVSAISEAMPVAGTSTRGIWSVNASRGGASLTASVDGIIEIPVGGSAGFTWNANSPDGTKHAVGPTPMALGMVSLTLGGADRVAFAVYSADDDSLDFYKRMDVPAKGSVFERKTVTEIYMGIESDAYNKAGGDWYGAVTTPWYGRRNDIRSINVIDDGIVPKELSYYFQNLENATSIDISKFSPPELQGLFHTFSGCTKLTDIVFGPQAPESLDSSFTNCKALVSVDLRPLKLGNVQVCPYVFAGCSSLKTIEGVSDIGQSNPYRIEESFLGCSSLESLDLSGWNTSYAVMDNGHVVRLFDECPNLRSVKIGSNWTWNQNGYGLLPIQSFDGADGKWYSLTTGKGYAPADIPSGKADTYVASKELLPKIAFAVYSADDASLDFYNRAFCDVPAAGNMFERKTVTDIYTGFEDTEYHVVSVGSDGNSWDADAKTNTPWFGRRKNIKTVQVVDSGIKPKSIQSWFQGLDNATNLSMSKLDVSACAHFCNAFANCQAATSIDISGWSAKPGDMTQMFYMCKSISSLDLSGFDGSRNITLNSTFHACFNLDDIKFGDKWTTVSVENFGCAFFGTKFRKLDLSGWNTSKGYIFRGTFGNMKNLEEIDISGWTNTGAEHDDQEILSTFDSDPKLRTVKVGSGWDWSKSNAKLLAISGENVAGADGKWYASSDGTGYAPADIPSGKADIYYSVAPSTFAVFSSDDGSLDFYNRAGKPFVGDTWQGKSVDEVYTGFETTLYHASFDDAQASINNGPTNCPWYERHDDVLSVSVVDCGIKPYRMSFWFQLFSNLKTVDIKKLDVSACRDWQHTFWCCRSLTELDLSGMNVSQLGNIESMFTDCRSLKSVSFSGWKGSPTGTGIMFASCRSLKSIDFGDIDFSKTDNMHSMFENCNSLTLDCTNWNISANIPHNNFNYDAPGVILPKPWQ